MLRSSIFVSIALAGVLFAAGPALAADAVCGNHVTVAQHLAKDYAEKPTAMGLASNGSVVEIYTSTKGGTWTIVMSMPNGQSCLMAAGEGWEMMLSAQTAQGPDA